MKPIDVRVRSRIPQVKAAVRREVGAEIRKVTLDLLGQSVRRAPVEEGTLRGSGTAHFGGRRIASGADYDPEATGDEGLQGAAGSDDLTGVVAFNTVYALYQHETLELNHPKGGEAKYLERPLEENRAMYERKIGEAAARGAEQAAEGR